MQTTYDKAVKVANSQYFGHKVWSLKQGEKQNPKPHQWFTVEGEFFNLEFDPVVGEIHLNLHSKLNIITECLVEELSEMNCLRNDLEPFMEDIVKELNSEL